MRIAREPAVARIVRRVRAARVLRAGDQVDALAVGQHRVVLAEGIGVQQRRALLPVLGGGVHLHQLGIRIVAAQDGERRRDLGEKMILVLRAGPVRLAELDVQEDLAGACDVRQHAVEDPPPGLIAVEAALDVLAQVSPGLRDAEGQRRADARHVGAERHRVRRARAVGGLVAQEREEVTRGGEADAEHLGILGRVVEVVDEARLERRALGRERDRTRPLEGPLRRRNLHRRIALARAHGQAGAGLLERRRLVGQRRHRQSRGQPRAEDELVADGAHDRRGAGGRHRDPDPHGDVGRRRLGIPAAPHQRVAQPKREAVAGVLGTTRVAQHERRGLVRVV